MNASDIIATFTRQAESVQTRVFPADAPDGVAGEIIDHAIRHTLAGGGKTLAAPGLPDDLTAGFKAACTAAGIRFLEPPLRDQAETIDTAVTLADAGIAETGSLVIRSESEDIRIATMMSETHIAWLPADAISRSMDEMAGTLDAYLKSGPGYLAVITGPSRTADIERVLAIGVHGPRELHVFIVKGETE